MLVRPFLFFRVFFSTCTPCLCVPLCLLHDAAGSCFSRASSEEPWRIRIPCQGCSCAYIPWGDGVPTRRGVDFQTWRKHAWIGLLCGNLKWTGRCVFRSWRGRQLGQRRGWCWDKGSRSQTDHLFCICAWSTPIPGTSWYSALTFASGTWL